MLDMESPQPGAYPDVPEEEYFALPAVNASTLKVMGRSAAHCKARLDGLLDKTTPAQAIGKALHAAVLEPARFPLDFMPDPLAADHGAMTDSASYKTKAKLLGEKVTGTKAELKARILAADPDARFWDDLYPTLVEGRTPLNERDWAMCQSVMASIAANEKAAKAFSNGRAELTLVWRDQSTGLLCKARLDYYREDIGIVFDLKSTVDARVHPVQRDIEKYAYHVSAAHYQNGLLALGLPAGGFGWVFIEKEPPFAQGLYFADADMLFTGRELCREYLDAFAECRATDVWPSYPGQFSTIELPAWAVNKI